MSLTTRLMSDEEIKAVKIAWANGLPIEFFNTITKNWDRVNSPFSLVILPHYQFRVAPPRPRRVRFLIYIDPTGITRWASQTWGPLQDEPIPQIYHEGEFIPVHATEWQNVPDRDHLVRLTTDPENDDNVDTNPE